MTRRDRQRLRHERELRARTRILPEASTRTTPVPSRLAAPFQTAIDAYRQTPESWREVWSEE